MVEVIFHLRRIHDPSGASAEILTRRTPIQVAAYFGLDHVFHHLGEIVDQFTKSDKEKPKESRDTQYMDMLVQEKSVARAMMLAAIGGGGIAMKVLQEYSKATNINDMPSDASLSLLAVRGGILRFVKGMKDIQNQERYPHYATKDIDLSYHFTSLGPEFTIGQEAARCGHNDILTWLIDQEPDMLGATASVKWGLTELHLSAMIGNQEAVHRLIEKQTSTGKRIFGSSEKKDTLGYNSLMYAAKNGVLEIVDVLSNPNLQPYKYYATSPGPPPRDLEPTIQQEYAEIKKNCTLFRLEIGDVNTVWKDGYTALHLAVSNGHAKVAALLIKRGANLQAKTSDGYTPLHIACERGFLSIAKICVEGVRSGDLPAGQDAIRSYSETGTPSAIPGLGAVKTALKTRVKCMGGNSPIHLAAEYGHAKILAYLVDPMDLGSNGKGQIPVDLLSAAGWTPLHVAAHNFYAEACKTLLGLGASIIAFSVTGDTPLSLAKKTKPILFLNNEIKKAETVAVFEEHLKSLAGRSKAGFFTDA